MRFFNLKETKGALKTGSGAFDFRVDGTGLGLFEKLVALAKSEGIDYQH